MSQKTKKKDLVKNINKIIGEDVLRHDLRRLDFKKNYIDITYQVNVNEIDMLEKIIHNLKKKYPTISVTYLDQNQVPSI